MPLQATSGAASYDAFGGGVAAVPTYIEEIFGTFLYTGNGSTQTITNGIDLAGKGGLVWIKKRVEPYLEGHFLTDTARGGSNQLKSETTAAQANYFTASFLSNGVQLQGNATDLNSLYASWTFRKSPKFFDVVTYTGNGTTQNIAHNLGSTPGCILVKCTSAVTNWRVYHREFPTGYGVLQTTAAFTTSVAAQSFGDNTSVVAPTSTSFTIGSSSGVNTSGDTYVAYLFAHNAGGFGLTGTDNVISCGSYTGTGAAGNFVSLGYEPQWVMVKVASSADPWVMEDNMRGMPVGGTPRVLYANSANEEFGGSFAAIDLQPTGFSLRGTDNTINASGQTYIYIAIRRGPMKVPTTGTSVFAPLTYTGDGSTTRDLSFGFPVDMFMVNFRNTAAAKYLRDRLRGGTVLLNTTGTSAESAAYTVGFDSNTGLNDIPSDWDNASGITCVDWAFRRAPGFFDVVCYTGTLATLNVSHNLGAIPQLIITKSRSATGNWTVQPLSDGTKRLRLQTTAEQATDAGPWDNTNPTSTQFTLGADTGTNASGVTYVAYLFASCPGVQYINSYVGDGTTGRTINCGFTGGARFVCIKATSTTGSWWTFDSARGIVTNNDPALQLNSTAAEVTSADAIDTASSGFIVNQESTCSLNASGVSYLVWAIA